jgi:hypothetical protein
MKESELISLIDKIENYNNIDNIPFRILSHFCSEDYEIEISSHIMAKFGKETLEKPERRAIDFIVSNVSKNKKVKGTIYSNFFFIQYEENFRDKYYDITDKDALEIVETIKDFINKN